MPGFNRHFSLLEIMMALCIFAIAVLPLLKCCNNNLGHTRVNDHNCRILMQLEHRAHEIALSSDLDEFPDDDEYEWEEGSETVVIDGLPQLPSVEMVTLTVDTSDGTTYHIARIPGI